MKTKIMIQNGIKEYLRKNLPAGGNFHGVKRIGRRSTIICRIDSDPKQTRMD